MIMHVDYVMYNKYMIYIQDYQLTHSMIKHKGTHVPPIERMDLAASSCKQQRSRSA